MRSIPLIGLMITAMLMAISILQAYAVIMRLIQVFKHPDKDREAQRLKTFWACVSAGLMVIILLLMITLYHVALSHSQ